MRITGHNLDSLLFHLDNASNNGIPQSTESGAPLMQQSAAQRLSHLARSTKQGHWPKLSDSTLRIAAEYAHLTAGCNYDTHC
jgi:hypothetical protein